MEGTAGNIEIGKVRAHRTWEEGVVVDVIKERLLEHLEQHREYEF